MYNYQWEKHLSISPKANKYINKFGYDVVSRYRSGEAKVIRFKVFHPDDGLDIILGHPFNSWGKKDLDSNRFSYINDESCYVLEINTNDFKHKTAYHLIVNNQVYKDPSTRYFDLKGDSVFWDFKDPSSYQFQNKPIDPFKRSVRIIQTDLPGLIYYYRSASGSMGNSIHPSKYYKFIAESGIIDKLKGLGFNYIQFLPISQSIDGDKWSHRYLVPFLGSINSNWGTPDEFCEMVDSFHSKGIGLIVDHVISHIPHKDYNLFGFTDKSIGIHRWNDKKGNSIYLDDETSWGTKRYKLSDQNVRSYIIDSAIHFLKDYKIDGFRIDNVDGILREGENGDGKERKYGRTFLREFNEAVYNYKPDSIIHFEAHYFAGNNAKWLVAPIDSHKKALGATAYTSSRLTHYLHSEFMPKSADDISPWKIRDIISEKEWGKSNSTIADFHNHDAAAGLIPMRATGSYAYDALLRNDPSLHFHAVGKIKVMESIISLGMEGRTLDLMQSHLLQTGSFEHDSSIHWYKELIEVSAGVVRYKSDINKLMDHESFWPINLDKRKYVNVDDKSKIIAIERSASDREIFIAVINMSGFMVHDYVVPVSDNSNYELVIDSDRFEYSGSGRNQHKTNFDSEKVMLFAESEYGLRFDTIPPYATIVLKKVI